MVGQELRNIHPEEKRLHKYASVEKYLTLKNFGRKEAKINCPLVWGNHTPIARK